MTFANKITREPVFLTPAGKMHLDTIDFSSLHQYLADRTHRELLAAIQDISVKPSAYQVNNKFEITCLEVKLDPQKLAEQKDRKSYMRALGEDLAEMGRRCGLPVYFEDAAPKDCIVLHPQFYCLKYSDPAATFERLTKGFRSMKDRLNDEKEAQMSVKPSLTTHV